MYNLQVLHLCCISVYPVRLPVYHRNVFNYDRRIKTLSVYGTNGSRQAALLITFWGSKTYAVHVRLIGKLVVDFLLVIIELFSVAVMLVEIRVNIDWKSPDFCPSVMLSAVLHEGQTKEGNKTSTHITSPRPLKNYEA